MPRVKQAVNLSGPCSWIHGPNGKHKCFVSEALGPDIAFAKDCFDGLLPISNARRVTGQLALGLAAIHRDIVHRGKLSSFMKLLDQLFWAYPVFC